MIIAAQEDKFCEGYMTCIESKFFGYITIFCKLVDGEIMSIKKMISIAKMLISILMLLTIEILIIGGIPTKAFAGDIVLRMNVSHSRNVDQISLTFKKNTVELTTNAFQVDPQNKKQRPQFGRFITSMTSALRVAKSMFESYYKRLVNSSHPDFSDIFKAIDMSPPSPPPHAPIFYLNEQKVDYNHSYFSDLKMTLDEIKKRDNWICLRCAEYRRRGISILRKVGGRAQKTEKRRTFSMEELNCRRLDQERLECIDPEFGIFEII